MSKNKKWQRKLLLLIKSEKRLGAGQLLNEYQDTNFDTMKQMIIQEGHCALLHDIIQKYPQLSALSEHTETAITKANKDYEPRRHRDLYQHLDNLQSEFIGQSELNFYHAILIVLLRRGYKPEETFQRFEQLWQTECDYLLASLSIRWIVSAADTFIDLSQNPVRQAILMNVVTLVNTLKAYETTQFLYDMPTVLHSDSLDKLRSKHRLLYDGLTFYRIGTDDTLKHMKERYQRLSHYDAFSSKLLITVFDRLHNNPTAFALLKQLHTDDKSKWW